MYPAYCRSHRSQDGLIQHSGTHINVRMFIFIFTSQLTYKLLILKVKKVFTPA